MGKVLLFCYGCSFLAIGIANAVVYFRRKRFSFPAFYGLFSTVILSLPVFAFSFDALYAALPCCVAQGMIPVLLLEILFSLSGTEREWARELLPEMQKVPDDLLDKGELVSLLLAAPAYLCTLYFIYCKLFA